MTIDLASLVYPGWVRTELRENGTPSSGLGNVTKICGSILSFLLRDLQMHAYSFQLIFMNSLLGLSVDCIKAHLHPNKWL